jgi:hypothetical protein
MQFLTYRESDSIPCSPKESTIMSEHKPDELTATGTHRAWTGEPGSVVRAGVAKDAQRNWLDRGTQPANPRHAAITRSLYNWTNYKNWTDKVRSNWDKDKDKDEK